MPATAQTAVAVIGIDIGKNSFHIVGLDSRGAIVLRQKWSRCQVEARLANMSPCHAATRMQYRDRNRRGQASSHRCECVVEQQRVRYVCAVVTREPDFVHAIVQAHDAVFWHHLPHVVHDLLRR